MMRTVSFVWCTMLCFSVCCAAVGQSWTRTQGKYTFTVTRLNKQAPMISSQVAGESSFSYNYNTAYVPVESSDALLVRCQDNASSPLNQDPYAVTSSVMALTSFKNNADGTFTAQAITNDSVVFKSSTWYESYAVEDPRVVFREKDSTYYLMYNAVEGPFEDGSLLSRIALATSTAVPPTVWERHGPILWEVNGTQWTKSGALLIRDPPDTPPHYLFFGDSSKVPGLQVATSTDLLVYELALNGTIWLPVRSEPFFDSALVESGPMPLPLSDGEYLMLYNSARAGYPSKKPGYDLQYNVGWLILDRSDPTKILERSSEPIISPEELWETGTPPYLGLTPNVVFVEGWQYNGASSNSFLVYYGAADSVLGVLQIDVEKRKQR